MICERYTYLGRMLYQEMEDLDLVLFFCYLMNMFFRFHAVVNVVKVFLEELILKHHS